jgi:hypothetical protein
MADPSRLDRGIGGRRAANTRGGAWTRLTLAGGAVALVVLVGVALWLTPTRTEAPAAEPRLPAPVGTRQEATPLPPAGAAPAASGTTAGPTVAAAPAPTAATRHADEAFGQIPALALPGDGGFGPRWSLTYERAPDLGALPASADVHQLSWPAFDAETVRELSRRLGLGGTVATLGPDAYQVEDGDLGRLFVAHGRILYSRPGPPATVAPDPERATEQARQWLDERQLLPADAGLPTAQPLPELNLVAVVFTPREPRLLITPEPSLTVTLDDRGEVRELDSLWPADRQVAAYPLAGLGAAWEAARRGDGYVELDAEPGIAPGQPVTGRVQVSRVTIGHALAGGPDAAEAAFLQPVYIFTGVAHLDGFAEPLPCRVYVPALRDYPWPRG